METGTKRFVPSFAVLFHTRSVLGTSLPTGVVSSLKVIEYQDNGCMKLRCNIGGCESMQRESVHTIKSVSWSSGKCLVFTYPKQNLLVFSIRFPILHQIINMKYFSKILRNFAFYHSISAKKDKTTWKWNVDTEIHDVVGQCRVSRKTNALTSPASDAQYLVIAHGCCTRSMSMEVWAALMDCCCVLPL